MLVFEDLLFMSELILASTSIYRKELLSRLRLPFSSVSPEVDESPAPNEKPADLAVRLALAKAQAVAARHPQVLVIGSDQVADLNGVALGKPGTVEKAVAQLQAMSGQSVVFHTAVALVCKEKSQVFQDVAQVRVQFRVLCESEIRRYVAAEMPLDCAGSAKSEGLGIALLQRIDSDDPTALIGLPLIRTAAMLRQAGLEVI